MKQTGYKLIVMDFNSDSKHIYFETLKAIINQFAKASTKFSQNEESKQGKQFCLVPYMCLLTTKSGQADAKELKERGINKVLYKPIFES